MAKRYIFSGTAPVAEYKAYPSMYLLPLRGYDFMQAPQRADITAWHAQDPAGRPDFEADFKFTLGPDEFWHLSLPADMYKNIYGFFRNGCAKGDHSNNAFTGASLPTSCGKDKCFTVGGVKYHTFCMSNLAAKPFAIMMLVVLSNGGYDGDGSETSPWG